MESIEIKSSLLKKEWEKIHSVYYALREELLKRQSIIEFNDLYDFS